MGKSVLFLLLKKSKHVLHLQVNFLGKKELAYHWLEKAMANQERTATEMAADIEFQDWQKEPRFRQMYKKINHPMYVDK